MVAGQLGARELDRAAGVVVGAAAGDALGAAYEFAPPVPADQVRMRVGRLTGRPAGSWTDDTDMAVGIVRAAATGSPIDHGDGLDAVAAQFLAWFRSGPPDIGIQTSRALGSASRAANSGQGLGAILTASAQSYQESNPDAAGNGSLMRTGPVALAALGDDDLLLASAAAVSKLTHPHRDAVIACQLWCVAIDRAVRLGHFEGLREGLDLLEESDRTRWTDIIDQAESRPIAELANNGWVVTALQAAWRAIIDTASQPGADHVAAGLRAAVAIGGDTDTVAAIAGALLGARYGASAVPFAWRRRLGGWPSDVAHGDLAPLAILTARHGVPDGLGWPTAPDLMAYYRENWHPTGVLTTLPGHEGILWGDVAALDHAPADAFISLCRIGRAQRRGTDHHEVWMTDGPDNNDLAHVLADTADAVEELRLDCGSVFVHCVQAQSRTPSVAAAWLVRHRGRTPAAAFAEVEQALPSAAPRSVMRDAVYTLGRSAGGR